VVLVQDSRSVSLSLLWASLELSTCDNRRSNPSERMPSTKDAFHRTVGLVLVRSLETEQLSTRPTLTRLRLQSRHPFLDFLWPFLEPESPMPRCSKRGLATGMRKCIYITSYAGGLVK
jgi:hypothetical protein